jgi:hypothetical protein
MMQDKINSIRDVMEIEQEAHDIEMENEKERFDTKIENAEKELRNKRTKRKDIQDVIDAVKNDEILSNEELSKVLPPLQAKQYEQKQKEILKNIFLIEMEKSYEEGRTQNQAVLRAAAAVRPLLEDLMPGSSAQTAEDIMGYLGASPSQTSYYGAPPGVDPGAAARRGNTGGSTSSNNDPSTWPKGKPGDEKIGPDGITYYYDPYRGWIPKPAGYATGGPIKLGDGSGGKVTGPGGPKSDVIPAYLSNGEYVIQASSVSKYGKDMMDNINAGKFAYGGYISADRAEYQASQKPKYSGGTPTYTGGYASTNTQASSNIYNQQKNKYGIGIRGIGQVPQTNNTDWLTSFITGIGPAMRDQSVAFLSRFTSPFGFGPDTYELYNANPNIGYVAPAAMTGRTQSEYADYVDAGQRDIDAALFASNFIPIPGVGPAIKGAGALLRRGSGSLLGSIKNLPRPGLVQAREAVAAREGFGRTFSETYLDSKYSDAIISHLIKASDDPNLSLPPGTNLVTYGADPQKRALIEAFISKYPYSPLARAYMEGVAKPSLRPIRVIEGETLDKITPIISRLLEDLRSQPSLGLVESNQVRFNKLAISDPEFIKLTEAERTALLDIAAFHRYSPDNVARSGRSVGLDSPDWARGQINKNEGNLFGLLSTIAHESGHTTDFATGASGYSTFGAGPKPYRRGILGDIQFAARAGKTEAYAEVNRMRAMHALLSDIGADPQDIEMFTRGGLGVHPYYTGVRAGLYGNSPVFKAMFYKTMRDVMRGRNPYFQLPEGFSTNNSGIISDALGSTIPWMKSIFTNPNNPAIGRLPVMSPPSIAPTKDEVIRLSGRHSKIDESILDNVFGTSLGGQGGINSGGWVIGADGIKRYVKSSVYGGPQAAYTEAMVAKMYRALGLEVPDVDLLTIGGKTRSYAPNQSFQPGSLVLSSREIENIKSIAEVSVPTGILMPTIRRAVGLHTGPPNVGSVLNNPLHLQMLQALARENDIGYATDKLFGLKDIATNIGNYGIKYDPNNPSTLLNPVRIDLGSNVFQDAGGNLIPFDPSYPLGKPKGLASHQKPPLQAGVSPSVMRNQVARLQDIIASRGGIRGLLDQAIYELSQTSPTYTLGNPDFVEFVLQRRLQGLLGGEYLYANGGLVQKFAEGGEALTLPNRGLPGKLSLINRNDPNAPANGGFLPGVGTTGVSAAARPTTTITGGYGGPNGWPYGVVDGGPGFPIASGVVPGTNISIQMNKDVLPLFLAFASDYNRLIRPLQSGITGAYRNVDPKVGNKSNHPSGTALDINWADEGSHYTYFLGSEEERKANFDWWKGKPSKLAPWKSLSPEPYKTMNALMNKYENVLQWFGPVKLGGYITDWMQTDPMHVQINQSTRPSPKRVAQLIGKLGINTDGTFNRPNTYAAGGFISGPGGPRSDMIPAMLSNGEYVVKASSVAKYGKGFMDQINSGSLNPFQGSSLEPRMFANGGMVGSAPMPAFSMPAMADTSVGVNNTNYAGNSSSTRNNTKVKVVINGAGGKGANAIANKVISMINSANNRRNHSRSI